MKTLIKIQGELKAPKNQKNSFGNYNYRSCEDILEAVKPLLVANECLLTLSDSVEEICGMAFIKSTATFIHGDFKHEVTAHARHATTKKGMDDSQITGSTSSYSRKYALNGLFCIDDTKDSDATNKHNEKAYTISDAIKEIETSANVKMLESVWKKGLAFQKDTAFKTATNKRKKELENVK